MNESQDCLIRHDPNASQKGRRTITEFAKLSVATHFLAAGETVKATTECETAWLLMSGQIEGRTGDQEFSLTRGSLFDDSPGCIHVSHGTDVTIRAQADTELTVYTCPNTKSFVPRVIAPDDVPNEHRGKGQVAGRCLRFVRTIFDNSDSPAEAELVLGEVVTLPGGWSSYPPHHHRQPEIYHYRFTEPQGFGHAELDDDVFKVRHGDTVCIPPGRDHAQCTAPGYGMYYAWVIRHLPDDRYTVPDFTEEHRWTMNKDAEYWWPAGVSRD